ITLMDLQLPVMSGLEAIRVIRSEYNDAKIIVLTMYQGDQDIHNALRAGAVTYLLKDTPSDHLIRIIREVNVQGRPARPQIEARLEDREREPRLTTREVQILELISVGMRNKEIATSLGITEETAHSHLKNIFKKLNVTDRTAAAHVALRRGIIHNQG